MAKKMAIRAKGPDDSSHYFSRISVRGYKSIREQKGIEIRPLTVLAGANSSGKSSIMQPLLLLKQTLEVSYDPGPLLINGPNVKFTSADQLFHSAGKSSGVGEFSIGMELMGRESLIIRFGRGSKKKIDLLSMASHSAIASYELRPSLTEQESQKVLQEIQKVLPEKFWKDIEAFRNVASHNTNDAFEKLVIGRDRCFLELEMMLSGKDRGNYTFLFTPEHFSSAVQNLIHLPGLRGNPERTYPVTAIGSTFPGTFEKYVASVISQWADGEQAKLDELGEDLSSLGLSWKVCANPIDDTQVELKVGRLNHAARGGARDLVNIADVGFGVSQTLPILTALLVARPGQLVYLEQPEIHLHPRAQVRMADLLVKAAKRGVQVVAETHSSLLLRGIQTLVANGAISPEQVKLHWFFRDAEGVTDINSADLDESGAFGEWPEDFDEVILDAEGKFLDAAEKRLEVG